MAWKDVDLTNVNPGSEPIPAGTYVVQLLPGAKLTDRGEIRCAAAITDGESNGRYVFLSYPNPEDFDWSPKALKVLQIALGVDSLPGEDPLAYLNRAAGNRFQIQVANREYEKNGVKATAVDPKLFTARPAA